MYLSDFFEKNKILYYDNLILVRTKNDIGQWIRFFLTGVIQTAENAVATLNEIIDLKTDIEKKRILLMGKRSRQGTELLHRLFTRPVLNIKYVREMSDLSSKSANDLVKVFVERGILVEITGYQRNRLFKFDEYLKIFQTS